MQNGTKPHTPQITVERITPHMAAQLLGTMPGNRPIRPRMVSRYAREMIADKWLLNGESIKVSRDGRLIDGQHRLNAVIQSKMTVEMFVVRGVDPTAFVTLDTGVSRTFHDASTIGGKDWPREVGTIARWWLKYERGIGSVVSGVQPSHQELDVIMDAHPGIPDSARYIQRLTLVRAKCLSGVQGFVHAYASEKYDREMADTFMQDLNDGAQLAATSPIYCLRTRLIDNRERRVVPDHVLALTIKAWNFWVQGEKVQQLRWARTANPEDFPKFSVDSEKTGQLVRTHREGAKRRAARAAALETSTSVSGGVYSR